MGPRIPPRPEGGEPMVALSLGKTNGFVTAGLLRICGGFSKSSRNQFFAGPPRYLGVIRSPTGKNFSKFGPTLKPPDPHRFLHGILHGLRSSRSIGIILSKNIIVKRGGITPPGLEQHMGTKLTSRSKLRQDARFYVILATTIRGGSV